MDSTELLDKLEYLFRQRPVVSIQELIDLKIFRSKSDFERAVKLGQINYIPMSRKLRVIPASEVIRYLLLKNDIQFSGK
jgi:hypothetical protein